ncbi:MAG: DUF1499 domain-containing protein [Gammaproteobacteria bacterium]|nr:DUF1499 domain-containing protein [Gammaproteobacteria bacterium]
MSDTTSAKRPRGTRWCSIGSWGAAIGMVMAVLGVAGVRIGIFSTVGAFLVFGVGALMGAISILMLLGGLVLSKGTGGDVDAGRVYGALIGAVLLIAAILILRPDTGGAPPIHDITTDLDNPPAFSEAMRTARSDGGAENPPEYSGGDTPDLQRAAFPELQTVIISKPPADVFKAAEKVATEFGWEVVNADASAGLLEATDTTKWFRFKDDVVIRIQPSGAGSAVDVRSKSRVGRGDMGANATRIKAFLTRLDAYTS